MGEFVITAASRSMIGPVRRQNQDRVAVVSPRALFVLADGIGGLPGGAQASTLAVATVRRSQFIGPRSGSSPLDPGEQIRCALREANQAILDRAKRDRSLREMGTTIALLLLRGEFAYSAGLGDSRVCLIRRDRITQLTRDHSLGQLLIDQGAITLNELPTVHRRNALTQYLGLELHVPPQVRSVPIESGDRFVLMSDGITNVVAEAMIQELALSCRTPRSTAQRLVSLALARGSRDNVSCVAVHVD